MHSASSGTPPDDASGRGARDSAGVAISREWSLEYRLPLLISALVACVAGGIGFASYREVRSTAVNRSTDRLERAGRELAASVVPGNIGRDQALHTLTTDSALVGAVLGTTSAERAAAPLQASRQPTDTTFIGWRLTGADGRPRFETTGALTAKDSTQLAMTLAGVARAAKPQRSTIYSVGERMHYWTAVPVLVNGRVAGSLAELRRLSNSSRAEATIRELIGDDVRVLYSNEHSGEWASLGGRPTPAPFADAVAPNHVALVSGAGGARQYVMMASVPMTPWFIVLLQSEASMLHRPQEFLRRMLVIGVALLVGATLGAWLLSRHVTRPLQVVTGAAAALARGDYTQRVSVHGGGSEVASLASTFNVMAVGIADAHAALEERNAELQRANAAKAQFLAMMSHELRTPLNAIGGFTELMELGLRGPVTSEQVEDLTRIRRNKDHLLSIITDILDFARTDAGTLNLKSAAVPIAPVLSDVVDVIGQQMVKKGVRLVIGPVPSDAVVRGDREKVQQVLLNLLTNALKFTEADGEVVVSTVVVDGEVSVDVRDTGIGIGISQLDEIFEPFVQGDSSLTRRAGGTGLGLAIARQLATAMRGSLTVRSVVGVGSTFTMTLPRAVGDPPVAAAARGLQHASGKDR